MNNTSGDKVLFMSLFLSYFVVLCATVLTQGRGRFKVAWLRYGFLHGLIICKKKSQLWSALCSFKYSPHANNLVQRTNHIYRGLRQSQDKSHEILWLFMINDNRHLSPIMPITPSPLMSKRSNDPYPHTDFLRIGVRIGRLSYNRPILTQIL